MMPAFEGLQPSDFMNTASRTTWHGRNQLGGAVTNQLPTDNFVFNLWALAQKPEMHCTDCDHRNQDDAGRKRYENVLGMLLWKIQHP
jgi:hypothetical protein